MICEREKWPRSALTSGAGRSSLCLSSLAQKHRIIYTVRVLGSKVLLKGSPTHGLASWVLNISKVACFTSSLESLLLELTTPFVRTFFLICNLIGPYMWQHCSDESLSHCYQDLLLIPAHHAPVRSPCSSQPAQELHGSFSCRCRDLCLLLLSWMRLLPAYHSLQFWNWIVIILYYFTSPTIAKPEIRQSGQRILKLMTNTAFIFSYPLYFLINGYSNFRKLWAKHSSSPLLVREMLLLYCQSWGAPCNTAMAGMLLRRERLDTQSSGFTFSLLVSQM